MFFAIFLQFITKVNLIRLGRNPWDVPKNRNIGSGDIPNWVPVSFKLKNLKYDDKNDQSEVFENTTIPSPRTTVYNQNINDSSTKPNNNSPELIDIAKEFIDAYFHLKIIEYDQYAETVFKTIKPACDLYFDKINSFCISMLRDKLQSSEPELVLDGIPYLNATQVNGLEKSIVNNKVLNLYFQLKVDIFAFLSEKSRILLEKLAKLYHDQFSNVRNAIQMLSKLQYKEVDFTAVEEILQGNSDAIIEGIQQIIDKIHLNELEILPESAQGLDLLYFKKNFIDVTQQMELAFVGGMKVHLNIITDEMNNFVINYILGYYNNLIRIFASGTLTLP